MYRPRLPRTGARLAVAILAATVAAAIPADLRAQVDTADVKPGASSGEILLTRGHQGPGIIPHESAAMPLGCYGCGGCGGGGCSSCGGCGDGGCGGPGCIPGRLDCCDPCVGHSKLGRLLCGIHHMLCCPDPCYEPCYIPAANAAMFQDSAKPLTQMRLRYDALIGGNAATQGGFFFNANVNGGNGPFVMHEFMMENEFAVDRFSFGVTTPFRVVVGKGGAGYADMRLTTKSLLVDSEFLLASFQFATTLPTGLPGTGTGNFNLGLEPSLLLTLKLGMQTYFQAQLAEWIGTFNRQSVFHYHLALNHTLTQPRRDMQLIGTMEFGSYVFNQGGPTFYNLGPAMRFHFCNKLDVGFGMQFSVSTNHFMDQLYRTELRWRF